MIIPNQVRRIDVQRESLGREGLTSHGRKLLEAQRRPGVLAAGRLEGQLLGQKHQHVGRSGLGDGHFGGIAISGQGIGLHASQAGVVAKQGVEPVVQTGIVTGQVADGGAGAGREVLALVHCLIHQQA